MITALGFGLMFLIVTLILLRRISPLVAFVTLPVIASALAGFGLGEIGKFITEGLKGGAESRGSDSHTVHLRHPLLRRHA